jgi:anti-sigma regulatory factor (Ser/Thr protein kinase)
MTAGRQIRQTTAVIPVMRPQGRRRTRSDVGPASKGGSTVTACWPLGDTLTLGARPAAVTSARVHARVIVGEWAAAGVVEDVTLIVSELVTNAVVASTETDGRPRHAEVNSGLPVVHLRLRSDRTRILIEVWDQSPRVPEVKQPEPDAENSRGLLIVEALSERSGWHHVPGWPGKVVWAEVSAG